MKRKISFILTVILLHTYLALAILVTLFRFRPDKWMLKRPGSLRIRKTQPSME